jgi:transcriptional regulator
MYIPRRYEVKDLDQIKAFVRAHSFGILVSVAEGMPVGTHIPLLLSEAGSAIDGAPGVPPAIDGAPGAGGQPGLSLLGHISKGNDQRHTLKDGALVMAIFSGPHAYISPRWYNEMNVPTWNYLAVHAYGTIELMEGPALEAALSEMVDYYETGRPRPVKVSEIPEKTYKDDLRGIIGFRIHITDLQAVAKMSQNRNDQSYHQVVKELDASADPVEKEVAQIMKGLRPATGGGAAE